MENLKQYRDYETISEKLMKGECPPEVFLALVGWATGKFVPITNNEASFVTNATPSSESRSYEAWG